MKVGDKVTYRDPSRVLVVVGLAGGQLDLQHEDGSHFGRVMEGRCFPYVAPDDLVIEVELEAVPAPTPALDQIAERREQALKEAAPTKPKKKGKKASKKRGKKP